MPLVSIIVPVYNTESYLPRCVDSILAQRFTDFELILVDDGSPDNCGAICDEYAKKDPRIRVIHKINGGLSSARNAGMDIARGEYFLFCDSDDHVAPEWCQRLVEQTCSEQNNFIFGGFTVVDTNVEPPKSAVSAAAEGLCEYRVSDFIRLQTQGKLGFACNVLYYAKVLEQYQIRFSQEVIVEDLPFNLEYVRHMDRLTFSGYPDYFYIQYPHQTLSRKYYVDGFRRWQEKYDRTQSFIAECVPEDEQEELTKMVASAYLYNFLVALNNTFDARNTNSLRQKLRFNTQVVKSDSFQHCLKHADCSREDPRYIALLKKQNYHLAYLLQVLAKLKNKIKRRF